MDNMLRMMEKHASNLEEMVGERVRQLVDEKRRADALLYRMLPPYEKTFYLFMFSFFI